MTGEMCKAEVTRKRFPLYFACAEALGRDDVTVEPFDQYQGPFINVPGEGRIFLSQDRDRGYFWYNDSSDRMSGEWLGDFEADNEVAIGEFCYLIEEGGDPVPDSLR